ncbi:mycofactocin system GMC family oxidoreductase MftG [Williamsia sp. SKLECPSW1]
MTARRRVVVVGGGSGGCVVAERLSRSGDDDVLVLEAGGAPDPVDIGDLPLVDSTRVRVRADGEGTPLPRGFGLGGSSGVNGAYFLRPHAEDLAGWDRSVWAPELLDRTFTELDGGDAGGGRMAVSRVTDAELRPRAVAFENAARRAGHAEIAGVWPRPGLVRLRVNATGRTRRTAADAFLADAAGRSGLRVRLHSEVHHIEIDSDTVRSVVLSDGVVVPADIVVLCAGTLGSAVVAARSGLGATTGVAEHRELLVRSRSRSAAERPGLVVQTVLHTEDGFEIRCYENDFADHVEGVPVSGPAVGVAAMRSTGAGSITVADDGTLAIDLGRPDPPTMDRMRAHAEEVAAMLEGPDFADLVVPGSTTIDATLSTSHHAWGTFPLGGATDWQGRLAGVDGLWVADASVLPTPLSSGPHETVMMVASVIAARIAAGD